MKWITVQEYAAKKGLSLAAVYKMVAENRVRHTRKFGKIVVDGKSLSIETSQPG